MTWCTAAVNSFLLAKLPLKKIWVVFFELDRLKIWLITFQGFDFIHGFFFLKASQFKHFLPQMKMWNKSSESEKKLFIF